jgi:serine/threonine protein kinase
MPTLNIDIVNAPAPIKQKLRELSSTISFDRQSRKGANSWLFFGNHLIRDQRIAVKFYDWGGDPAFHAEPRTLAAIQSANVIPVFDAAYVDETYAYFVTPFFHKGDLDDELGKGSIGNIRALKLTRDLLSGLSYLHAQRLLHRDLKPENIFISETDNAVIGDFGSVKKIPEGHQTVPGSGHSLIYRPPESVTIGQYGICGDIYQIGLVMYQLLGGSLPYDEISWLSNREQKQYRQIYDNVERQIFASRAIKRRIERGRVIDMATLPPWVCVQLRRTISKACTLDPTDRFQSCAEFLARCGSIRSQIRDWRIQGGFPTIRDDREYRIVPFNSGNRFRVQKRCGVDWRYDNSFRATTMYELVKEIEDK